MVQDHTHVLNRKLLHSVRKNIEQLKSGSFDERNVKELLIDLREIARKHLTKETNEFTKQIKDFVDICDFIPHTNRDRGTIEKNICDYVKTLHEELSSTTIDKSLLVPNINAINADKVVNAMLAFAYFVLSSGDKSITQEYILDVFKYKDDIALCLLSLLQDSKIDLKEDEGAAILFILPFEGRYRLYCQVLNSRIEREARERTSGTGTLILAFPVMFSFTPCIDDIPSEPPQGIPKVFETFRDAENKLRMRAIQ